MAGMLKKNKEKMKTNFVPTSYVLGVAISPGASQTGTPQIWVFANLVPRAYWLLKSLPLWLAPGLIAAPRSQ
jgi:hypothetical protein